RLPPARDRRRGGWKRSRRRLGAGARPPRPPRRARVLLGPRLACAVAAPAAVSRLRLGLVVIAYNQPLWTERLVDAARAARGDLDGVAAKAMRCRERYIVSCAGPHQRLGRFLPSHGYSFFAVNPIAIETIGCFDENFFPAYCEDQDYARRAALAGLSEENCAG